MSEVDRLRTLTDQMHLEVTDVRQGPSPAPQVEGIRINHACLPGGRRIPLLKTLLSSYCENNCLYCPFRSGRDFNRAAFNPDGFARLFLTLHRAGIVDGLFLSSGLVGGGIKTQDKLIATATLLRRKYHFSGYLHLKVMPGAERDQIYQAMTLADRVSVNLEAPTPDSLRKIAPRKRFQEDLLDPLLQMEVIRQEKPAHLAWKGRWPSSTTQFVVGSGGESDRDILQTTQYLHREAGLARSYFSRFNPIRETPLETLPPTPPARERRLFQASYLIRDYGFTMEEMPFKKDGMLPLYEDPKEVWARKHLLGRPVELNSAPHRTLLRIPGIGLQSAASIINARRESRLKHLEQLKALGVRASKAQPYITLDGKAPARQLALF